MLKLNTVIIILGVLGLSACSPVSSVSPVGIDEVDGGDKSACELLVGVWGGYSFFEQNRIDEEGNAYSGYSFYSQYSPDGSVKIRLTDYGYEAPDKITNQTGTWHCANDIITDTLKTDITGEMNIYRYKILEINDRYRRYQWPHDDSSNNPIIFEATRKQKF